MMITATDVYQSVVVLRPKNLPKQISEVGNHHGDKLNKTDADLRKKERKKETEPPIKKNFIIRR